MRMEGELVFAQHDRGHVLVAEYEKCSGVESGCGGHDLLCGCGENVSPAGRREDQEIADAGECPEIYAKGLRVGYRPGAPGKGLPLDGIGNDRRFPVGAIEDRDGVPGVALDDRNEFCSGRDKLGNFLGS